LNPNPLSPTGDEQCAEKFCEENPRRAGAKGEHPQPLNPKPESPNHEP